MKDASVFFYMSDDEKICLEGLLSQALWSCGLIITDNYAQLIVQCSLSLTIENYFKNHVIHSLNCFTIKML